jgi:hypothetical protein
MSRHLVSGKFVRGGGMPVLIQAGRSAQPKQGHDFHNPSRRRLWITSVSTSLLWRNYKVTKESGDMGDK